MDHFMWTKTLILCSRSLKRVTENIDIAMENVAMSRGSNTRDTYALVQKAIDVIERKKRIINLRVITNDMLKSIPLEKRHILSCRYFLGDSMAAIAAAGGISIRSAYRRLNAAIQACADHLLCMGFDSAYLEKTYGGERWMMLEMRRFDERDSDEFIGAEEEDEDLPDRSTWGPGGYHSRGSEFAVRGAGV